MLKNKTIFALGATFLFLAVAMIPASAGATRISLRDQEHEYVATALNRLIDDIECATSFAEVIEIIKEFYTAEMTELFPILRDIIKKIIDWVFSRRSLLFNGNGIGSGLDSGLFSDRSKEKFIISFGSYQKRLLEKKDEKITIFKQGFALFRYSGKARLSQGRTVVAERKPFAVQQRVKGSQIGVLVGFSGLFIDVESKLTGNSYVFIMGNARRAKAFDLTPFSN